MRAVPSQRVSSTGSGCSLTQRRRGRLPRSVTRQAASVMPCGAETLEAAGFVRCAFQIESPFQDEVVWLRRVRSEDACYQ